MFERPAIHIESVRLSGYAYQPFIQPVRMAGTAPLLRSSPRRMAQLVSIAPDIHVDVNTGIEKYLFPIGLMAGGASMFILGTAIPMKLRWLTTLSGLGLMAGGVGILIYRGTGGGASGPAAPAAAPAPSGGTPVTPGASAPAFQPPSTDDFAGLQIQVVSPAPDQSIAANGGFLGFGQKTIPMQLRIYNPAANSVTFNLDFSWMELPSFSGYDLAQHNGTYSAQVTVGAGEEKNQTFSLPIQTDVPWTQIQVALALNKKRTPSDNDQLLSNITFTVT